MYCGQTAGWIKMPLGTEVGLGPGYTVLDGDPARPSKGHSPQFSAHVCCSKTAGLIKMPLGMEVGLGSSHIVLDGDPAPRPEKGTTPPSFRSMSIVAKRSSISSTAKHLYCYLKHADAQHDVYPRSNFKTAFIHWYLLRIRSHADM